MQIADRIHTDYLSFICGLHTEYMRIKYRLYTDFFKEYLHSIHRISTEFLNLVGIKCSKKVDFIKCITRDLVQV